MNKKPELIFMPGCFDEFEGTQEELDALVNEIKRMAENGEFFAEDLTSLEEDIENSNSVTQQTLQ